MGRSIYSCSNNSIIFTLLTYNEVEVARKAKKLSKNDFEKIKSRVLDIACAPENSMKDGSSMLLNKAVALAAVEFIEGNMRELKYKKRNFSQAKGLYFSLLTFPEKIIHISLKYILPVIIVYLIIKWIF